MIQPSQLYNRGLEIYQSWLKLHPLAKMALIGFAGLLLTDGAHIAEHVNDVLSNGCFPDILVHQQGSDVVNVNWAGHDLSIHKQGYYVQGTIFENDLAVGPSVKHTSFGVWDVTKGTWVKEGGAYQVDPGAVIVAPNGNVCVNK